MNNNTTTTKRNLTAIAAVFMAATLVVGTAGTFLTTKTAFAASNYNSGNTVTALAAQNRGFASGFDTTTDQEAQNLTCTHPGDNAACIQEGPATKTKTTPTPIKLSCEECFTTILNSIQITAFLRFEGASSIADVCLVLENQLISESALRKDLITLGLPADELIACLKDAGIVFGR